MPNFAMIFIDPNSFFDKKIFVEKTEHDTITFIDLRTFIHVIYFFSPSWHTLKKYIPPWSTYFFFNQKRILLLVIRHFNFQNEKDKLLFKIFSRHFFWDSHNRTNTLRNIIYRLPTIPST